MNNEKKIYKIMRTIIAIKKPVGQNNFNNV